MNELGETSLDVVQQSNIIQHQHVEWHDKFVKNKVSQKGDWALLYDYIFKYLKEKPCTRSLGHYNLDAVFDNILAC